MAELMHYGMTRQEVARKAGKHESCFENRLRALCGNGSYHAQTTRDAAAVTCPQCLKQLKGN